MLIRLRFPPSAPIAQPLAPVLCPCFAQQRGLLLRRVIRRLKGQPLAVQRVVLFDEGNPFAQIRRHGYGFGWQQMTGRAIRFDYCRRDALCVRVFRGFTAKVAQPIKDRAKAVKTESLAVAEFAVVGVLFKRLFVKLFNGAAQSERLASYSASIAMPISRHHRPSI